MRIPDQYLPIMPYLILDKATAFLTFTKEVFEAKEQLIVPNKDGSIMHGEIRIGNAVVMFGQAGETWKPKSAAMYMYVLSVDITHQSALKHGARSLEEPQQKEYGYSASFEDPFDNQWFIVQG